MIIGGLIVAGVVSSVVTAGHILHKLFVKEQFAKQTAELKAAIAQHH